MRYFALLLLALTGRGPAPVRHGRILETGTIVGKVALSSVITSRKMHFRLYEDRGVGAVNPSRHTITNEMSNVVIYLDAPGPASGDEPHTTPIIAQRDEAFIPHVLPVIRGSTVEFLNQDPFFHNVFSLSKAQTFDLGRYPRGQFKSVQFAKAGPVRVFCHIHADMSAVVLVLDNPLFTSPDSAGHFELAGVPPGQYRVVAWHERAPPVAMQVNVVAGRSAEADFSIPIPDDSAGR